MEVIVLGEILMRDKRDIELRLIRPSDDVAMSKVIRAALVEFGADRPGFAWQDPELDALSKAYTPFGCFYLVAVDAEVVLGGAGIGPLSGVDATCELQKMYLAPSVRGIGVGRRLMRRLLEQACLMGYRRVYLETFSEMVAAQRFYRSWGFLALEHPLGQTGHGACDCWFLKELHSPEWPEDHDPLESDRPLNAPY